MQKKFRGVIPAGGKEAGEAGAGRGRCGKCRGVGAPSGGWAGGGRGLEGQARVVLWKGSPPGGRGGEAGTGRDRCRRYLGAGPRQGKRASEKQGWRGRWHFREEPCREEKVVERRS